MPRPEVLLRKPMSVVAALLVAVTAAACSNNGSTPSTGSTAAAAKGGDLTIVRAGDSVSMDNTMVFSNASIWVFQQILESLYEVSPDGKGCGRCSPRATRSRPTS